jgi:hypothetical protein
VCADCRKGISGLADGRHLKRDGRKCSSRDGSEAVAYHESSRSISVGLI